MARLMMRPYEHFTQKELTTELRERAAELLELAKTAATVVEAWASGRTEEQFNFKMLHICRLPCSKARLLRHAAREAQARLIKPKLGKGDSTVKPA